MQYETFFGALLALMVTACSTHRETVKYSPSSPVAPASAPSTVPVNVGLFADNRGTDAHWLGAIRGGYGNVLKRIETDKTGSEVVHDAFVAALEARNIPYSTAARIMIDGSIQKMDCSYYMNKEAHAHLQVSVTEMPGHKLIYQQAYTTDRDEPGVGAGIFGDPDALARLEQETLNQSIDKAFSDPQFLAAISGSSYSTSTENQPRVPPAIEERLRKLEDLHKQGLISDEEYRAKRKDLLDSL